MEEALLPIGILMLPSSSELSGHRHRGKPSDLHHCDQSRENRFAKGDRDASKCVKPVT